MRLSRPLIALTVLAGLAGAGAGLFARDLVAARRRVAGATRRMVTTPQGLVEVADLGVGAPVMVLHGAAGGFDQSLDMAGALAGEGFRLIAPSRFGYLGSPAPDDAGPDAQADALAAMLDTLNLRSVTVAAISAGAWSALAFAARHPARCRALVLIGPAQALPPGVRIHGGALATAVFHSDLAAWLIGRLTLALPGLFGAVMLGAPAEIIRAAGPAERVRLQQILDHLLPIRSRSAGMTLDVATAAAPPPLDLARIACPVLAIAAEDDVFGTDDRARQIAAGVGHGRALILPDGGHALVGRVDEALRAAAAFLRENG